MDNQSDKEANEIFINFNNENYEFDHDYTKPFSRSKSIVEKSSFLKDDSIQTDTYKSKKTNKNDESFNLSEIKKLVFNTVEECNYLHNYLNNYVLGKELIEQIELKNLFAFVEKQNNLLKEVLPYLSMNSETKKNTLNDKLKNNFINKIYDMETKLSEKDNIISQLKNEIQNLKSQNLNSNKNNNNVSNDLENSDNKSEQLNDSFNSTPKLPCNGFVSVARNSIYSNNKNPKSAKTPLTNQSEACSKQANQKSNGNVNFDKNRNQTNNVKEFEIEFIENQNNSNHNQKPEFYQRKRNRVLNEEQRSKSFCHGNTSNLNFSGLDFNSSVLNENERLNGEIEINNNSFENENKESKIYSEQEPKLINSANANGVNKIQDQAESGNNLAFEKPTKSTGKSRGRNISLPDFNNLHNNPKDSNEIDYSEFNHHNNNNNIEIELKNNSFTDVTDNVYVESNTFANANPNPNNYSKFLSSPENKNAEISKNKFNAFNKNNILKDQEILNKIKDNFLSLSSCDNSLNSSINNISHVSNKSGNNNNARESDNKKIRRNKSLFDDRCTNNPDPEESQVNPNNDPPKRKSQNFSYLNLLINNKNLKQAHKEANLNYYSDKENSDFNNSNNDNNQNQNPNYKKDEADKFKNNCKELNMNLINEALKLNSNDGNLISNSPLHHNIDAINNQLNLFNYKSFKNINNNANSNTDKISNLCVDGLKSDKSKGADVDLNQKRNKPINKSNSVVIKNRRNRDYKNYFNNFNNPKNKIEKKFAEDDYNINSEQDMNTEPINSNISEKFYLEKLAFDINLHNLTRLKNETSKNKKISSRYLKETLFRNDIIEDELINLNSDENQGNNGVINHNHFHDVNENQNVDNQARILEQKEDLNFSFNNSKNDIKVVSNCNNDQSSVLEIKDKVQKKPSLRDSNAKNVKKITMIRNEQRNNAVKKPLNEKKGFEIKSSGNKKGEVINTTEENNKHNVKEIKFQNAYLNKKLVKDNNTNNSKTLNTKESLEQANNSMVLKSKEYSKNIKALNDKNIKKIKVKNTNDSKTDFEYNNQPLNTPIQSNTNSNNNKSKVSSVKMRKNYEESLSQNRQNLLSKLNKKSNANSNSNHNNNNKSTNKLNEDNNKNNYNNNLNSDKTKSNLFSNSPLHLESNGLNKLSKKTHFSKSTCDFKNEIYLNINKDSVFSLKPDECLNLSENEYISNKESSKNENYKESLENVFSLENEKTPFDKKPKNLIKESSINKISEDLTNDADEGVFANKSNKFTLSHRDLLLPNSSKNESENLDNQNYFERVSNENKRLSSRSKSFVEFDKLNINENSVEEGEIKSIKSKKFAVKSKVKKNEDLLDNINERNKEKIEMITSNLNKNTKKDKEKLDTSLNDSTKGLNQTQGSISFNFINNISINAPGNSSFVIEDNDKPATYTKKLLAKYYKYVDDYNKRVNNESSKTTKNPKLDDSRASKSTNKK